MELTDVEFDYEPGTDYGTGVLFYIKSADRKAHYTMLEIKALRQVRDRLEELMKRKNF